MAEPLRIGASACFFHADPKRPIFKGKTLLYLEQSIANYVHSRGALLYLIPTASGSVGIGDLARELDGLVLQGGSDVSPRSYGEEPLKPEWGGDFVRDGYETALVREFQKSRKPILGICRGAQLVNVAFGGTLFQDIETQAPGSLTHRDWEIYDQNFHEISFAQGSSLAALYGKSTARVNSVHHQAVRKLGTDLVVEATCPKDGIIEAIRHRGDSYLLAVQWHPEFHDPNDRTLLDSAPLMDSFLKEVNLRRKPR